MNGRLEVLKEINWNSYEHTYVLRNGKLIAFIREGSDVLQHLTPMFFSKNKRKFMKVYGNELQDILVQVA